MGGSILGASPDIRQHRSHQIPHGPSGYGFSPTGHFCSMSLGVSPSQFTPPNSQIQVGPVSPGSYSSVHGSPLGKGSAFSKHHRKRNSGRGYHGSAASTSHEGPSQPWLHHQYHPPHHHYDGFVSGQPEGSYGSPRHSVTNSRQEGSSSSPDPGDWDPNYRYISVNSCLM